MPMEAISITNARSSLYKLVDKASVTHKPILITGKRGNAVLVSEEDWNSIQETLHLLSPPGMGESLLEGMETPISECNDAEEIDW